MKAYRGREGNTPHITDHGMHIDIVWSTLEYDRLMKYTFIRLLYGALSSSRSSYLSTSHASHNLMTSGCELHI